MEYKIISMDFDGTLLTSNKRITDKTKKTLLKYKKNNYFIVGVTSRVLASVKEVCDLNMFDYLILNNGAYIYDVKTKEIIKSFYIDREIVLDITKYFKEIAEEIDYCTLNKYYIYKKKVEKKLDFLVQINGLDEVKEQIGKINIFINNNIDKYKEYIENTFEKIDVIFMSDTDNNNNKKWLVLSPKGINKLETLKLLCKKVGTSIEETIFFGDSTNDLEIICGVGLGVAMGNALEEIKEHAKDITLSNDNDGIAYYLENLNK